MKTNIYSDIKNTSLSNNDRKIVKILKYIRLVKWVLITTLFIVSIVQIPIHIWLYFYPLRNVYEYLDKVILPSILFFGGTFTTIFCTFFVIQKFMNQPDNDDLFKAYRAAYYPNRLERYYRYVACCVRMFFSLK